MSFYIVVSFDYIVVWVIVRFEGEYFVFCIVLRLDCNELVSNLGNSRKFYLVGLLFIGNVF